MTEEPCQDKCARYTKGVRQTWWCGLRGGPEKDHKEHDHLHKGKWYHCYG